eukprot:11469488-Ditylum_brightwellii.AAC.1
MEMTTHEVWSLAHMSRLSTSVDSASFGIADDAAMGLSRYNAKKVATLCPFMDIDASSGSFSDAVDDSVVYFSVGHCLQPH